MPSLATHKGHPSRRTKAVPRDTPMPSLATHGSRPSWCAKAVPRDARRPSLVTHRGRPSRCIKSPFTVENVYPGFAHQLKYWVSTRSTPDRKLGGLMLSAHLGPTRTEASLRPTRPARSLGRAPSGKSLPWPFAGPNKRPAQPCLGHVKSKLLSCSICKI